MGILSDSDWARILKCCETNLTLGCHAHFAAIYTRAQGARNITASVILSPLHKPSGHVGAQLVAIGGFAAGRGAVRPDVVHDLLSSAFEGKLLSTALPDGFPDLSLESQQPYSLHGPHFHSAHEAFKQCGLGFPCWIAAMSAHNMASSSPEGWDDAHMSLPANDPPFDGLRGLARDLGIPESFHSAQSSILTVIAPVWIRLRSVAVVAVESRVDIVVETLWPSLPSSVSLSLIPLSPSMTDAKRRVPYGPDWVLEDAEARTRTYRVSLPIPVQLGRFRLSLNFAGNSIDSHVSGVGSGRVVAHELIDPKLELLRRRWMSAEKDRAHLLEEGVSWLLHLCGFSCIQYGAKDVQHSPDIVAFLGNDRVAYVECTTETPDTQKIRKLKARAHQFAKVMQGDGESRVHVKSLLVIGRPEADLPAGERVRAEGEKVTVAFVEVLDEILRMAYSASLPEDIWNHLFPRPPAANSLASILAGS